MVPHAPPFRPNCLIKGGCPYYTLSILRLRNSEEGQNWLFAETEDGGEASANIYSLVMTARANKLHVGNYFRMLIEKLPLCKTAEDYAALLPY
jgi:hypothetical protein